MGYFSTFMMVCSTENESEMRFNNDKRYVSSFGITAIVLCRIGPKLMVINDE